MLQEYDSAVLLLSSCLGVWGCPLYALPVGFGEDIEDQGFYADALLLAESDRDQRIVRAELYDLLICSFLFDVFHRHPPSAAFSK